MTTITMREKQISDTLDILWRNFFDADSKFRSIFHEKDRINYPISDIFVEDEIMYFEIALAGVQKSDIAITVEGDMLRVKYANENANNEVREYITRNIARRSFDIGWRVDTKYDLNNLKATLDNGMLRIAVPVAATRVAKTIKIS
jgi:HSP20 family molecular chaperone IbpA